MRRRKLVTQYEGTANHRRERRRDLLEILLSFLQERQGPVRDKVSRRPRQSSGVSDARAMRCSCAVLNLNDAKWQLLKRILLLGWTSGMMAPKSKDTSQT